MGILKKISIFVLMSISLQAQFINNENTGAMMSAVQINDWALCETIFNHATRYIMSACIHNDTLFLGSSVDAKLYYYDAASGNSGLIGSVIKSGEAQIYVWSMASKGDGDTLFLGTFSNTGGNYDLFGYLPNGTIKELAILKQDGTYNEYGVISLIHLGGIYGDTVFMSTYARGSIYKWFHGTVTEIRSFVNPCFSIRLGNIGDTIIYYGSSGSESKCKNYGKYYAGTFTNFTTGLPTATGIISGGWSDKYYASINNTNALYSYDYATTTWSEVTVTPDRDAILS